MKNNTLINLTVIIIIALFLATAYSLVVGYDGVMQSFFELFSYHG